jgi:CheY-like chemotaxis protein
MDLHMPEMDGLSATTEIRKRPEFKHRPYIIAVTANVQESIKKKCLTAGMNDFIEKPFKLSLLSELLKKAYVNNVNM